MVISIGKSGARQMAAGLVACALVVGGAAATLRAQDYEPQGRAGLAEDMAAVPESRAQINLSFAPLVKQVSPAVVNIYTKQTVKVQRNPLFSDPFFRRFFGDNSPLGAPQERVRGSLGSGVLVRADGVIVTNNHVVGEADEIRVVLADRREYEAELILKDERTDLAILKIDAGDDELPALELADSDAIEVGDLVVAIGNPLGLGQTVTSGIVSATARTQVGASNYQFFIQTDAAINPGNSGGALVDLAGRLTGINTFILTQSGGSIGIGFAIPSNMVQAVVSAAVDGRQIMRPWMGASGQAVTQDVALSLGLDRPGGVLVDSIYSGGPADLAGIIPGDVILAIAGKEVLDTQGLRFRVATANGEGTGEVLVSIYRGGKMLDTFVTLDVPPEQPLRNITQLSGPHAFQGVTVANLNPRYAEEIGFDPMASGVIVTQIDRRSPAGRRQFVRPGDIFLYLGEKRIETVDDLASELDGFTGDYVYRLRRGAQVIECGIINNRSFYCR